MEETAAAAQMVEVSRYYAGAWRMMPETILALGSAVLLLLGAFRRGARQRSGGTGAISLGFIAAALVASILCGGQHATLFSGMVVLDPFVDFFRILFCAAGALGIFVAMRSSEIDEHNAPEYYSMFLALVFGMMLMASASDLVMIYLSVELVSLMSYVLAGFRRRDRKSAEAALKYVIYGGAASGVMLFGFSLIYGLTGHTQLSLINGSGIEGSVPGSIVSLATETSRAFLAGDEKAVMPVALGAGLVLAFAGFAYKIAAVPLHMWSPDVYEGAPTPFTAFLSTGPKAAGFALLIRFFVVGFADAANVDHLMTDISRLPWVLLVIVVAILTMTVGNLSAIGQSNIKRFLAYSSIAHAGYSLIGLAAFSKSGAYSILLYMVFYLLMNIGAFYAVIWVHENVGSDKINDYKGLGERAPFVAVCFSTLR